MASEVVFDSAEVRQMIDGLVKRFDQFQKRDKVVIGILSAVVYRDIMAHFDEQRGEDDPWPQWSPRYRRFMEKIGKGGNRILQDSGRLRQSFQPTNVRPVSPGLLWFNNAKTAGGFPYAAAHDEGGKRLPKRDFMWLSREALDDIEEQIIKFIES